MRPARVLRSLLLIPVLALAGCGDGGLYEFPGYMEADLVLVGSEYGGRVDSLSVKEGDRVTRGTDIFTLESDEQLAEVEAARARVAEADARLADARRELQRPREIEVLKAARDQAHAMLQNSKAMLERNQELFDKGWIAQSRLDEVMAQHDRDRSALAEAERRIEAAELPTREDLIDAAAASAKAARYALAEAQVKLAKRCVSSPAEGTVEEVYFRPGEVVNAGQAVVALLPPGNLKVRFYVPEPVRASLRIGQTVEVSCDGCEDGLTATVSFIAREAEFTPPVIYSREQREKLVFLVEALPSGKTAALTAGQPITVTLLEPAQQVASR